MFSLIRVYEDLLIGVVYSNKAFLKIEWICVWFYEFLSGNVESKFFSNN